MAGPPAGGIVNTHVNDAARYKMLLCHRRAPGRSRAAFHAHWRGPRKNLVLELQKELGFEGYSQTHQFQRCNLIYQGIRISRSRFVTNLFARKEGQQIGPKPDRQTTLAERWDVVEELIYPSRDALVAALTATAGREAGARLVADHRPRVRRTAVMAVELNPVIRADGPAFPPVTTLFFLRSRSPLDREQMLDYWKNSHAKFFASLQDALAYSAYDQMYVRSGEDLTRAVDALGGSAGEPFDGVAWVAYDKQWTVAKGFLSLRTQIANIKLIRDEVTFIDGGRSTLMFGEANRFGSGG
jgi:hypothetical protein